MSGCSVYGYGTEALTPLEHQAKYHSLERKGIVQISKYRYMTEGLSRRPHAALIGRRRRGGVTSELELKVQFGHSLFETQTRVLHWIWMGMDAKLRAPKTALEVSKLPSLPRRLASDVAGDSGGEHCDEVLREGDLYYYFTQLYANTK